jgi:NitT/TauT family transport system substrate-binding protein
MKSPSICLAPQDIADELLRGEGFRDIRYLPMPLGSIQEALASGELDLGLEYASKYVAAIDRGLAVTVLAGAHVVLRGEVGRLQRRDDRRELPAALAGPT